MKNIKNIFALGFAIAVFASCSVTVPVAFSDAKIGSKEGVSTTSVVLGIQTNGKYGIREAADNGKITGPVATVDEKTSLVFPLFFYKKELIITGE
ncbi:MAG: hypothetical protein HC896_10530 [Bacteroidales bacterium]|nr:hypothetical protein [Bacteroidales bacterium]